MRFLKHASESAGMEAKLKCKCGNEMTVSGTEDEESYEIDVDGGKVEKAGSELFIICGKCGERAGKVGFFKQVEEK